MSEPPDSRPDSGPSANAGDAPGAPVFRVAGVETETPRIGLLPGVLRFFVVPLLLVGASLAIFAGLGALVARGTPTTENLLREITDGGKNARWQAAQELSNQVARGELDLRRDEGLARSVAQAFRRARREEDDPRVVEHLALVLGRGPAAVSRPALEEALGDGSPDVRIFVLAGLAQLADPASLPVLRPRLEDLDPGVRTVAAYAVAAAAERGGPLVHAEVRPLLVRALADPAVDVRWNAALGLARLGLPGGEDVLWNMLHRDFVRANLAAKPDAGLASLIAGGGADPAAPEQVEERVVLNALSGVYRLRDRSMIAGVRRLAADDPSDSVRDWAMRTATVLDEEIARRGEVPAREWSYAE